MRWLRCNSCEESVGVYEEPREYIDLDLYVCGQCLEPVAGQLELDQEPRTETRPYDPTIAQIPF